MKLVPLNRSTIHWEYQYMMHSVISNDKSKVASPDPGGKGNGRSAFPDLRPEAAAQRKLQNMINTSPQLSIQRQKHESVFGKDDAVVQRNPIIMSDGLANRQQANWNEASENFKNAFVAASPLAAGPTNQVVLWGIPKKTFGTDNLGVTKVYIGKDGYEGEDYQNFINIWEHKQVDISKDVAVRVLIAVNLSAHKTVEEIYTTLLHEWLAHAVKWEAVLNKIRANQGKAAITEVHSQGEAAREMTEHKEYANLEDETIDNEVSKLGLESKPEKTVSKAVKNDRNAYDKNTGAIL